MGQRIPDENRKIIARMPGVHCLTAEHVFMQDGRVLDPKDFIMQEKPILYVAKLLDCACGRHEVGLHIIVPGKRTWNALSQQSQVGFDKAKAVCPGDWTVEEVIDQHDTVFRAVKEMADKTRHLFEATDEDEKYLRRFDMSVIN